MCETKYTGVVKRQGVAEYTRAEKGKCVTDYTGVVTVWRPGVTKYTGVAKRKRVT